MTGWILYFMRRIEPEWQVRSINKNSKKEIGDKHTCTYGCPINQDGCVIFKLTATPLGNENFHTGGFWDYPDDTFQMHL